MRPGSPGCFSFALCRGVGLPVLYTSTAGGSAGGVFFWWGVLWLGLPLWTVLVGWWCPFADCPFLRFLLILFSGFFFLGVFLY